MGRLDWSIFTAAASYTSETRDKIIKQIHFKTFHIFIRSTPFSTTYNIDDSAEPLANGGNASPAQGAMFALLSAQ